MKRFHHLDLFAAEDFFHQRLGQDQLFLSRPRQIALHRHIIHLRCAATATLAGSVQGVVVQTSSEVPGLSTSGMRTKTEGSVASS